MKKTANPRPVVVTRESVVLRQTQAQTRRLSWNQIQEFYAHEWVELVDYKWPWNETNPTSAVVRCHATDRATFDKMRDQLESRADSLVLFMSAAPSLFQLSVNAAV